MFNGVNVGPQNVAGNVELGLDGENVLGGQLLAVDEPAAHGRLTSTDYPAKARLRTGLADGKSKRGVEVRFERHSKSINGVPLERQTEKRLGRDFISSKKERPEKACRSSVDGGHSSKGDAMPKSIVGDRIQQRLDELGISQTELSRRVGLAQSTINGLIIGKSRSSAHLHVIARQLGVSTAWLAGVRAADDRGISGDESAAEIAERLGIVLIPLVDLAGEGDVKEFPVLAQVPISRDWIHEWAGTKERGLLFVSRFDGDDMSPTICSRDLVLFDSADTEIRKQDKLWVVSYGGLGVIRRVRRLPDGGLELRADNRNIQPIVAAIDEVRVIGRVAGIVKSA